jgi:hypothetical protein
MQTIQTSHWNSYLSSFKEGERDIYFREEYVYLYQSTAEQPTCVVVEEGENCMLFPFLQRTFHFQGISYCDFETAYGYGGPIYNTTDEDFRQRALQSLYQYLQTRGFVAGFVRFHPLLNNFVQFESIGRVIPDRSTVAMNLMLPEEEIWMQEIHTKNRNVIKRGIKNGLEFLVDDEFRYLPEFIRLYNATMDKLAADGFYYFEDSYYQRLVSTLENRFLGVVKWNDCVVSGAIFFYEGPYAHYHLSGSDKKFLSLSPNNFMLYQAALELKRRGAQRFHLGGGTTSSPDDSLFCFKSRFSKSVCQFAIGKMIFNEPVYKTLCQEWELRNPDKVEQYKYFLLKYKY